MNTPVFFRTALAVATLSAPVQDLCAQTQRQAQQLVTKTSFGILVLKGQSIDANIKIPRELFNKRNHGGHTTKEILELEIPGGCGTYGTVQALTSDGKLVDGALGDSNTKEVFDIRTLEEVLNENAKGQHLPRIKADGRMTQETVNLMLKTSFVNGCG